MKWVKKSRKILTEKIENHLFTWLIFDSFCQNFVKIEASEKV